MLSVLIILFNEKRNKNAKFYKEKKIIKNKNNIVKKMDQILQVIFFNSHITEC